MIIEETVIKNIVDLEARKLIKTISHWFTYLKIHYWLPFGQYNFFDFCSIVIFLTLSYLFQQIVYIILQYDLLYMQV